MFYSSYGHQGLVNPGYSTLGYPGAVRTYQSYQASPLTTRYSSYSSHPVYPVYQAAGYVAPASVAAYQPYAAAGRYLADSVGAVHIAKREAEAEPEAEADAEPAVLYSSYGQPAFFNQAYNTYPYNYPTVYSGSSFYQPYFNNFGYRRSFYGKREAEAEPEAEADPALVYGQHGLYNTAFNTPYNTYNTPYNTYNTAFTPINTATAYSTPALRSFAPSVGSIYPSGYSVGSAFTGYRNFLQPSYFVGSGHHY